MVIVPTTTFLSEGEQEQQSLWAASDTVPVLLCGPDWPAHRDLFPAVTSEVLVCVYCPRSVKSGTIQAGSLIPASSPLCSLSISYEPSSVLPLICPLLVRFLLCLHESKAVSGFLFLLLESRMQPFPSLQSL